MADGFGMTSTAESGVGGRQETGSLQRGLMILEVLQAAARPMMVTEIAEAVGQPISTVHRLLNSLIQSEYAFRDSSKRYLAAPKAYMPLNLYHPLNVLRADAREYLRALRDQFRQTTSLIIFLGVHRLVVELAVENESLSPYHATHLKSPLHGAASGKILLASLPPKLRADLLGPGPYKQATPHTITDPQALEAELELTRSRGYAIAVDENYVGLSAVAAPIRASPHHTIGCFDTAGLTTNFSRDQVEAAGRIIKMTAELFSIGSSAIQAVAAFANPGTADVSNNSHQVD